MAPARLLADSSLDYIARRLRFLGFDVATLRGARLEELFEAARAGSRTVLTLSPRHPRRFADIPAIVVARSDPMAAVRAVSASLEPAGVPFSRCPACNRALERRPPSEAAGRVPGPVIDQARPLRHCPACGRWYWHGSHVDRVRAWLERALGRPVPAPPAG